MKLLKIQIVINEGKIASAMNTQGIDVKKIEDCLILVGVVENLKLQLLDRLKVLMKVEK